MNIFYFKPRTNIINLLLKFHSNEYVISELNDLSIQPDNDDLVDMLSLLNENEHLTVLKIF